MMIITLLFTYNSRITTRYLEENMTLCECLQRCTGMCNDAWVTCMKELWTVALPQIQCQLHDHAKQYDNDGACHSKRNGGKLHGNISRNDYGNAIIGRYGGCFEEGIWWVYDTGERCAVLERLAMVEGWECIWSMDSTLVIKNSYTYWKNLQVIKAKYYAHAPRGIDW